MVNQEFIMTNMTSANGYLPITSAIVIIGDEIIGGRVKDTNSSYIAKKLIERGISVNEIRISGDNGPQIVETVKFIRNGVDYAFVTAGIGPTHDDITAENIAKAFGVKLVKNQKAYEAISNYYSGQELTAEREKMSYIPDNAEIIPNPLTAAPGFYIENVFVMAGIPKIMQGMLDHVLEKLEKGSKIYFKTITCSMSESIIAPKLREIQNDHPDVTIGSYPHFRKGELNLSIALKSFNAQELEMAERKLLDKIYECDRNPHTVSFTNENFIELDTE